MSCSKAVLSAARHNLDLNKKTRHGAATPRREGQSKTIVTRDYYALLLYHAKFGMARERRNHGGKFPIP